MSSSIFLPINNLRNSALGKFSHQLSDKSSDNEAVFDSSLLVNQYFCGSKVELIFLLLEKKHFSILIVVATKFKLGKGLNPLQK
jgi:hypothetical protein